MEKKRLEEESKPRVIPDTVMRKQIRRIANSLVTSVITSAIVTVLVSKGKITQQQVLITIILYTSHLNILLTSEHRILALNHAYSTTLNLRVTVHGETRPSNWQMQYPNF